LGTASFRTSELPSGQNTGTPPHTPPLTLVNLFRRLTAHQSVVCRCKPPPNKGPPWTKGGTHFWALRPIRAVVHPFLPFSLQFPLKRGVDFYLDRFWGVRGRTSIRAWNTQGGWTFIGGLTTLPPPQQGVRSSAAHKNWSLLIQHLLNPQIVN